MNSLSNVIALTGKALVVTLSNAISDLLS